MRNQGQLQDVTPAFVDFDCAPPTMPALILDYLRTHTGVTFVDLEDDVPDFLGELTLTASSNRSTILWRGLSGSAIHALRELERHGEIHFKETSLRTYQRKGKSLHSSAIHWNPVLIELKVAETVCS